MRLILSARYWSISVYGKKILLLNAHHRLLISERISEPFDDGWPQYKVPFVTVG